MSRLTDYIDAAFQFTEEELEQLRRLREPQGGGGTVAADRYVAQQFNDGWYIVDTQTRQTVGGPYKSQAIANTAISRGGPIGGSIFGGQWMPGDVDAPPARADGITPPSFQGGAGLAERFVDGSRGTWRVTNRAGETLAGPFATKEVAERELENIELGITRPLSAGGATTGSGGGAVVAAPDPYEGMSKEQIAAAKYDAARAQSFEALGQAAASYQAQGMRVVRVDENTIRVYDENPNSPTYGKMWNSQYVPQRGRVESSAAVTSSLAAAAGVVRISEFEAWLSGGFA